MASDLDVASLPPCNAPFCGRPPQGRSVLTGGCCENLRVTNSTASKAVPTTRIFMVASLRRTAQSSDKTPTGSMVADGGRGAKRENGGGARRLGTTSAGAAAFCQVPRGVAPLGATCTATFLISRPKSVCALHITPCRDGPAAPPGPAVPPEEASPAARV